jgi:pantetheine-phosphate adenylyltransferase
MTAVVYPGTFDPITNGHVDLVERAARLFGTVIVAIAHSEKKRPLFDLEERTTLCQQALEHLDNVEIRPFSGLLTHLVASCGTNVVLRGLRSGADFEYELQLANMNRALSPQFESVFLTPPDHLSYVSASLVREIASMGGDVQPFVHGAVLRALEQKFSLQ